MKKWKHMMLIVCEALLIVVGAVVITQRENIQAVYEGVTTSQIVLKEEIIHTQKKVEEALECYELKDIGQLTREEEEKVKKGERSEGQEQEVMASAKVQGQATVKEPSKEEREKAIVKHYTAQMYALQSKYVGLLGGLESRGIQALKAIPSEERSVQKMVGVGMSFVQEGLSLEQQCDGEVAAIFSNLKRELKDIGADDSIVEVMSEAYDTEKRLKKAYYFSLIQ